MHRSLLGSTALSLVIGSVSLLAFDGAARAQNTATTASGGTIASELVITAQKRTEKLESATVSAAVLNTAKLAQHNAGDISDLNNLVPSVNLSGSFNGRVPMGIRGVSSESNEATVGISSGVAVLIDGVPVPSDSVSGNQLDDVERIEVLKGPQATLGGRTAAAGIINIITHGPKDVFGASVSATATNDDEQRLNATIAGPIVKEKVDFSLSAWADHIRYPIENIADGKKSDSEVQGARAKLLFTPNENLDITLTGRFNHNQSHGENFVYTYVTPGSTLLFAGSPLTQALLLPGITPSKNNFNYASVASGIGQNVYDEDLSLNIDYKLGDFTLSSTTAYQFERLHIKQDLFALDNFFFQTLTGGHAPPFYNFQQQNENIKQPSEELKLLSPVDRPVSYILGFFASDTRIVETYDRGLEPALVKDEVTPDTATYDLYGRATWKVTPTVNLIAGLRYNYDVIKYRNHQLAYTPVDAAYDSRGENDSSTVVGDITLQKEFSAHSMAYLTYARGYSPAAYNTAIPLTDNTPIQPVQKEDIDHFELGSKGSYFDRRLTLNLALFDTEYHNFQVQTYSTDPRYVASYLVLESANARTRGLEVDSSYQATPNLGLSFNGALIDATFTKYPNAACWYGEGCLTQDVSGKTLPNAPKLKFNVGADQRIPLTFIPYDLILSGDYVYRTKVQFLPDQNPQTVQSGFGLLNLSATLKSQSGAYSLQFFVNNVLDKHYFVDMEDYWSSVWSSTNTVIGEPARDSKRYFGVKLSANFF